jgi:hypothetical protein
MLLNSYSKTLPFLTLQHRAVGDLGVGSDEVPTGQRGHPEDVLLQVVVARLELLLDQLRRIVAEVVVVARIGKCLEEFGSTLAEGVGHILQEDQPQHDMHVVARVDVGAQTVGRIPESPVEVIEKLLFFGIHSNFPAGALGSAHEKRPPCGPIHSIRQGGRVVPGGAGPVRPVVAPNHAAPGSRPARFQPTSWAAGLP